MRVSFTDDADNVESLASTTTGAVAKPPLTASPEGPSITTTAYGGSITHTYNILFSEELSLSHITLRDHAFTVDGGRVVQARRTDKPSNLQWEITVQSTGNSDMTITLPVTEDCATDGAMCTEDGRKLSNELEMTVSGSR